MALLRAVRSLFALSLLVILATGCRPTIKVNGITVIEDSWKRAEAIVLERATVDLDCPRDQLETSLVEVSVQAEVRRLRVSGCNSEQVYQRTPTSFEPVPEETRQ